MNKDLKIIMLGFLACISFVAAFMFFFNDIPNYSILCITLSVIFIVYLIYTMFSEKNTRTLYETKLKNVLKTYDSDIIYADSDYEVTEKNIMFVKSLDDLLVASSILETPIIYIDERNASTFLVKNEDDLLVFILKVNKDVCTDFEKKLNTIISNNENTVNSILNNITKETIIVIDNKSYKVKPVTR